MKIGFVSITVTMAIVCLASSTEARIGSSRNLIDSNTVGKSFIYSTGTGAMTVIMDTTLIESVATTATTTATTSSQKQEQATREQQQQQQQQQAEENDQGQDQPPKPLPSFDQVMHKDAPSHGMYAEGGPNRTRSFCARHNHLGPNSSCEQHHASLRGSRVGIGKKDVTTTATNGEKDSSSFLQHHVYEAQSQHHNRNHQQQQQQQQQKEQEEVQHFDGK